MKKILLICLNFLGGVLLTGQSIEDPLENSPQHQERITLTHGDRSLEAFLVYPETGEKVTGIIVIHENRGLNDWARSMTDQLAEHGYIALAPDLLSGAGPQAGKTGDFPHSDWAREALYKLDPNQATADLNAAFVCCGRAPEEGAGMDRIKAPVYGFYGGNDQRVSASIEATKSQMKAAGKSFEPVIYEGAGHGFMRSGKMPDASPENVKARQEAWTPLLAILDSMEPERWT